MDTQNLIDMANRIGDFFESMPDHEEALTGVAEHIRRFWEPRMRRALLAAVDGQDASAEAAAGASSAAGAAVEGNGVALSAFVKEAIVTHRAALTPAAPADAVS